MSALEIQNIRKTYGDVETLKGIDISLESGEFLVLLGSSGCGKSTLLNIIAGLAEATSGDVRIGGRSVLGVHPKDRDIAMVFQSYALYPNLTVHRNIGFGLEMRKVPVAEREKAVHEAAKLLQIENLLDRKPSQLSGGQRQRVAIGRALVRKPQVFLFDEPLSNLDAKLRMEMRTELKRLHQMLETTVVYVTHDQIEAMTLATRIAVMRDGRIEQLGTPEEIYNHPATLYVAGFRRRAADEHAGGGRSRMASWPFPAPMPPCPCPPVSDNAVGDGARVVVGIRPEALRLATDRAGPVIAGGNRGRRTDRPGTGRHRPDRQPAADGLPAAAHPRDNEKLTLSFDEEALHLFDPASGMAF